MVMSLSRVRLGHFDKFFSSSTIDIMSLNVPKTFILAFENLYMGCRG